MRSSLLVLCLLGLALTATATLVKHAEMKHVPSSWVMQGRANGGDMLEVHIAIKQQRVDMLEDIFWARSNPKNEHYGKWLSFNEVNELVAPKMESLVVVYEWLQSHGIDISTENVVTTPNSDMISLVMSVAQAEQLLHTQYFNFQHKSVKKVLTRTQQYFVPQLVAEHIDFIGPTTHLFDPMAFKNSHAHLKLKNARNQHHKKVASPAKPNDNCSLGISPACLRQLMNINNYVASVSTNSVSVTGYLEQYISLSDLATFFQQYVPSMVNDVPQIIGPNDQTNPGTEASLDIQYVMGVGQGVNTSFWYTAGRQPNNTQNEPFLVFLQNLASDAQAPWVVSTSYGDDEPSVDYNYATRCNTEFMKAGARGISILFSSGDGGVAGGQGTACGPQGQFVATYPAGSPVVTAVGGTTSWPETAASFSSGGFSNYWPSPSYQTAAVKQYLTVYGTNIPPQNLWNATGRAFPDVAAQSENFPVVQGGFTMPVDGTSCASPTFAGVVALLNDVRMKAGKSSLGFLNPLFYQNPSAFFDCTSGTNPGCNTNGFTATKGWDPVTGLGSPNFASLSTIVAALP